MCNPFHPNEVCATRVPAAPCTGLVRFACRSQEEQRMIVSILEKYQGNIKVSTKNQLALSKLEEFLSRL